jgi:hypothetical protein
VSVIVATGRVIPIKQLATGPAAIAEDTHARLERTGFMRMMVMGEPRLSQLVEKYKALGYEVEVVPFMAEEAGGEAGCDTGLDAGGETSQIHGTIYVRKHSPPIGED